MMDPNELEVGGVYRVTHKKKGTFVVQLLDIIPSWEGDEYDQVFLYCQYDVRAGTDQGGLATIPGKQVVRESNLRPSLISNMEHLTDEDWHREMAAPLKDPEKAKRSVGDRLRTLFGGGE